MRFDDYATEDKLNGVQVILNVRETSVLTFEAGASPGKKSTQSKYNSGTSRNNVKREQLFFKCLEVIKIA